MKNVERWLLRALEFFISYHQSNPAEEVSSLIKH